MVEYRSVSDLNESVQQLARSKPTDIDLVVGIPRSGLLAANLLCLHLDVPMTDVEGLCKGKLLGTGHRYDGGISELSDVQRVLVLDDSVNTGRQMAETKEKLAEYDFPFDVEFGAVYVSTNGYRHVDYWQEVVRMPRVFEWNLMHHPSLNTWCVDIDGVLCRDPTPRENDDGENYREFITEVEPEIVPAYEVGWLVTCRLEKYREETETWLDEHGIEYGELVMMGLPSKEARQAAGSHGRYKADIYASTGADLFVESSARQAREIVERTGKQVYCVEENQMFDPGTLGRVQTKSTTYLSKFIDNPVTWPLVAGRIALDRGRSRLTLASERLFDQ